MTRITTDDPRPNRAEYRLHLTRPDIDEVLHHTHWIANLKGFTAAFLAGRHPGWSLPELIQVFKDCRILLKDRRAHPIPGRCHWRVVELFYNSTDDFVVVVNRRAQRDDRFFSNGHRDG